MKTINIPQIYQEKGSQDCGPTCTNMILKYFGIEKDVAQLKDNLRYDENGTSIFDNGLAVLSEGLKATAITAQPYLFSPDLEFNSKEDVIKRIDERLPRLSKFKSGLEIFKKYLNSGGELKIEIPSFKHIKEAIDKDSPIIALLYGGALGTKEGGFHFVIVNGYDDGKVLLTNPLVDAKAGWFPVEHFLYAVHSSTTYDMDNGTLLVISR